MTADSPLDPFLHTIHRFILAHELMRPDGKYLVALSGGADSVCLLLVLQRLGYQVEAAHCNFLLRGEESHRDERFCIDLCQRLSIPLHLVHFDTHTYAAAHHVSIEMAARELRYAYFAQLREDIGAAAICVAHHQDDSVETFLLNVVRGTGLKGLRGVQPRRGDVVRPLLCVTRTAIEGYLASEGQAYVTDSTNLQPAAAVRNRIRLEVLPLLQSINPGIRDSIMQTTHHMGEAFKVYDYALAEPVARFRCEGRLSLAELVAAPSAEALLHEALSELGFTPEQVADMARRVGGVSPASGRRWQSASHEVLLNRSDLLLQPLRKSEAREWRIPEAGLYSFADAIRLRVATAQPREAMVMNIKQPPPNTCYLDAQALAFPLCLRPVRAGDRFVPLGMVGSKLLSDYMTDAKLSLFDKQRQLVLTRADGQIVWTVGVGNQRIAHPFRITEATTEVVVLEWEFLPPCPSVSPLASEG